MMEADIPEKSADMLWHRYITHGGCMTKTAKAFQTTKQNVQQVTNRASVNVLRYFKEKGLSFHDFKVYN